MPESHDSDSGSYYKTMKGVAATILIMGVSLVIVILLWEWFVYIGPHFSSEQMLKQPDALIQHYRLPPREKVSKEQLQVPPSLRNITESAGGANATSAGGANATSAGGANATSAGGANATSAGGANATRARGANATSAGGANATSAGGANATSAGGANATSAGGANATSAG